MKKTLLALAAAALFAIPTVQADDQGPGPMMGPEPAEVATRMQQNLDLTDAQKKTVEAVFTQHRAKLKAAHQEMVADVEKVLTPEQRAQWATLREKRMENMGKMKDMRQEKMEKRKDRMDERKDRRDARKGPPVTEATPAPSE